MRRILRLRDVDVQALLDVYGVTGQETREAYRRLAREAPQTGWWVGYRDVLGSGRMSTWRPKRHGFARPNRRSFLAFSRPRTTPEHSSGAVASLPTTRRSGGWRHR
ncbi:hypothetical protein ABH917_003545 [Thermobifida halotolerans]